MTFLGHNMGVMEPWFVVVPMWVKQRLVDRYGSVGEALQLERQDLHQCIGVHFCGDWTDPGEKYLWDGTRVDAD